MDLTKRLSKFYKNSFIKKFKKFKIFNKTNLLKKSRHKIIIKIQMKNTDLVVSFNWYQKLTAMKMRMKKKTNNFLIKHLISMKKQELIIWMILSRINLLRFRKFKKFSKIIFWIILKIRRFINKKIILLIEFRRKKIIFLINSCKKEA